MREVEGKAVGWRAWRVGRGGRFRDTLFSLSVTRAGYGEWMPGENRARCSRGGDHDAPGHGCECGLYAYVEPTNAWELREATDEPQFVRGVVLAWGDMEVHPNSVRPGFRAARAEVLCLILPKGASPRHREIFQACADRYRVPLVAFDQAKALAAEHGRKLPADVLRPMSLVGQTSVTSWPMMSQSRASMTPIMLSSGQNAGATGVAFMGNAAQVVFMNAQAAMIQADGLSPGDRRAFKLAAVVVLAALAWWVS